MRVPFVRRWSHSVAYTMLGLVGWIATSMAPVLAFGGASTSVHVLPPSVVRYRPRWPALRATCPAAATNTRLGLDGSTAMRPIDSLRVRPTFCQWPPLSVDL